MYLVSVFIITCLCIEILLKICNYSILQEILGVTYNSIVRMDPHSFSILSTWRFSTMKSWNVNWEIRELQIEFDESTLSFACSMIDCKIIHEFIGGYIYLSMRKEGSQANDEEMFHKLTGGWDNALQYHFSG